MNNSATEIDNWLVSVDPENEAAIEEVWESGFEVDRQVVYSKFGPYKKLFLRTDKFVPRFYHTVYPLAIEEWQCLDQVSLYDGFCTIDIELDVRFQATLNYAISNVEILTELNEHIKNAYHSLSLDIVNRSLLNLSDGSWVQSGLGEMEKKISLDVSEMLILQNIQSQVVCKLTPSFEAFPDVQFAKESVYLCVLKKSFEFNDQQREELFRQQQEEERQSVKHKRLQLDQINEAAALEREKQALHAENAKQLLQERALQQLEQYEIKREMHEEKVRHNIHLQEITLAEELNEKQQQQIEIRKHEEQEKEALIAHQAKLKEKELEASITEYESEQAGWRAAKDKSHAEELDLKHRQKQLEFDTDIGYKQRYEQQRLAVQEESYATRKKSDVYLKREIELLELEKQRLALQQTIKSYKENGDEKRDVS